MPGSQSKLLGNRQLLVFVLRPPEHVSMPWRNVVVFDPERRIGTFDFLGGQISPAVDVSSLW